MQNVTRQPFKKDRFSIIPESLERACQKKRNIVKLEHMTAIIVATFSHWICSLSSMVNIGLDVDSNCMLEAIRSKILFTEVCDKNKMLNGERGFISNT